MMSGEPSLNKPELIKHIRSSFGFDVHSVRFLPIGFDARSFSYECYTSERQKLYLKLRLADHAAETLSASLWIAGQVAGAIHPLRTIPDGESWTSFGAYKLMVFPFVSGTPGWSLSLTGGQWEALGRTFRSLHDLQLPARIAEAIPRESYADTWRVLARNYLFRGSLPGASDKQARAMQALLVEHHDLLLDVIDQADELSRGLTGVPSDRVCCHGDLHSGNFLGTASGLLHPVDWDNICMAPREKDLMFVGAGIGGMLDGDDHGGMFAVGYGPVQINRTALRYFRLERIIQDVVAFCERLLDSQEGGAARSLAYKQFARQFDGGGVIDVALGT